MAKAIGAVAIAALVCTLGFTLAAIWNSKSDLFQLLNIILSWPIIASGLAVGAAKTFHPEIKTLVDGFAGRNPETNPETSKISDPATRSLLVSRSDDARGTIAGGTTPARSS